MYLTGSELITAERYEQLLKHGRTIAKDVKYNTKNELLIAAEELLISCSNKNYPTDTRSLGYMAPPGWDKDIFVKMMQKPVKGRLIIAGALIAAELDRLHYIEHENNSNEQLQENHYGSTNG